MDSSSSCSVTKLKKQMDMLSEFNFDSSQNVSDLLGSTSIFSSQSSPNFSTPTASAFDEEDNHLLDFLDSSKIEISTIDSSLDQSDISINVDFTPPKISRRRTFKKDKQKLSKNKEKDVSDFLDSFNNRYNLKATNLNEIIDFIESIKLESNESKKENDDEYFEKSYNFENPKVLYNGNSDQQVRIAQLQIERDSLQSQIADFQVQIKELQNQISNYKISNTTIIESNKSLQRDITNLQNSMNSFHDIVEQQLSDISTLSKQRAKLIEVTKKQESIIQMYDSLYKSDKQSLLSQQQLQQQQKIKIENENQIKINLSKQQAKLEADMKNDFYTMMCSIVHSAENFLAPTDDINNHSQKEESLLLDQIHQIRDNSDKNPRERILLITKSLISSIASYKEKNDKNEELIRKQTESIEKYQRKCRDILSMYEEELTFLQTITHSNDLQAAIFSSKKNQTPIILNDECKSELIRQCAILGRFIEETIGSISSDSFYNSFEASEIIDSTNIFQLLQKSSVEKKISNILNKIEDPENLDTRQIFDLLTAQVYMNEVLKNYANELQVRLTQNCHELNFLRQENETLNRQKDHHDIKSSFQKQNQNSNPNENDKIKTLQKLVKTFQKRENKLKRFTSNFVEIDDESNIIDATISLITQMNEQLLHQQSLSSQIIPSSPSIEESRLKEELNQCQIEIKELEKQLKQQETEKQNDKEFTQQIETLNSKLKESENQSQSLQNEIQNLKNSVQEKEKQIEEIKNEQMQKQKQYDISLDEAKNKLDSSIHTIKSLTQEVKQYETVLARAKKQRPKLIKEIERLSKINQKLSETISNQNKQIKNDFEIKISQLKSEVEKCQKEKDVLDSKNQQLIAEIATLTIEKKSTDLKVQAFDKRIELEKQNLITQMNAKNNSIQVDYEQKINFLNASIEEVINRLSQLITDEFSLSNQVSLIDNLKSVVSLVESEMKKMKNVQCLYVDLLDDVNQAQKLLKVGTSTKISETVSQLLTVQESQLNSNSDFQKIIKQDKSEIEKLKRTINKFESKSASLKHWENWAKRLFRVIHETDTHQLNSDELRLSLEEALLASVSHRSTMFKIESLRSQKIALLKFDSRLLLKPIGLNNISMHSIIAVCIFIRRAQIQARCLPISVRNNNCQQTLNYQLQRPENLNKNNSFDDNNKNGRPIIKSKSSVRTNEKIYVIKSNK